MNKKETKKETKVKNEIQKDTKKCNECNEEKSLTEFNRVSNTYRNMCKNCQNLRNQQYKAEILKIQRERERMPSLKSDKEIQPNNNNNNNLKSEEKTKEKNKIGSFYKMPEHVKQQNKTNKRLKFFNEFKEIIEKRNFKCLSQPSEYETAHTKLRVECINKHEFAISLNNIKKNRGCPSCNINYGEYISVKIFEYLFDKKFSKIRPEWLRNDEGNLLELDGYNDELKLAFEYNGIQHYEHIVHFYKTEEGFEKENAMI